jgi:hypothetical protein
MPWDYSIEIDIIPEEGIYNLTIFKTMRDEVGSIITKVPATTEDAKLNAENEFLEEFYSTALTKIQARLVELLTYDPTTPPELLPSRSHGAALGNLLAFVVGTAKELRR